MTHARFLIGEFASPCPRFDSFRRCGRDEDGPAPGDGGQKLDEHVEQQPRRVLERVAHRVAVTAALCASDPLPPNIPVSTYFFALSHAPPALLRKSESRIPSSSRSSACRRARWARGAASPATRRGSGRRRRRRSGRRARAAGLLHLLERRRGDDRDAARVVGLLRPLHDPRALVELVAHLVDHLLRARAHPPSSPARRRRRPACRRTTRRRRPRGRRNRPI